MTRSFILKSTAKTVVYGTVLAAVLTGLLFALMNEPQCPQNYTQEQIDASRCIVGANIGLGLLVICIPLIWAVSIFIAAVTIRTKKRK